MENLVKLTEWIILKEVISTIIIVIIDIRVISSSV